MSLKTYSRRLDRIEMMVSPKSSLAERLAEARAKMSSCIGAWWPTEAKTQELEAMQSSTAQRLGRAYRRILAARSGHES